MSDQDWQTIGVMSQASGESFEAELEFQASRMSKVRLVKQHPETKFFGAGKAKVVGTAYPDFMLFSATDLVMFDAKRVGKAKNLKVSIKRQDQFFRMVDAASLILAGYLVHWEAYGEIGWHRVHGNATWPPGIKYATATDLFECDLEGRWFGKWLHRLQILY